MFPSEHSSEKHPFLSSPIFIFQARDKLSRNEVGTVLFVFKEHKIVRSINIFNGVESNLSWNFILSVELVLVLSFGSFKIRSKLKKESRNEFSSVTLLRGCCFRVGTN